MKHNCNHCNYEWDSHLESPKSCPKCKSYKWKGEDKDE